MSIASIGTRESAKKETTPCHTMSLGARMYAAPGAVAASFGGSIRWQASAPAPATAGRSPSPNAWQPEPSRGLEARDVAYAIRVPAKSAGHALLLKGFDLTITWSPHGRARRVPAYTTPGPHTVTVTATDPGGLTSAAAATSVP